MSSRDRVRRRIALFLWWLFNPVARALAGIAPWWVVLETTGRRSGEARQVPLARGPVDGRVAWLIAVHGERSSFVRNIAADPRVRLRLRGTWYEAPPASSRSTTRWSPASTPTRAAARAWSGSNRGWSGSSWTERPGSGRARRRTRRSRRVVPWHAGSRGEAARIGAPDQAQAGTGGLPEAGDRLAVNLAVPLIAGAVDL